MTCGVLLCLPTRFFANKIVAFSLSLSSTHPAFKACEEMEYILPQLNVVMGPMIWDSDEAPSDNILHARLRAKFFGAEVLTYRPFLKMILNRPEEKPGSSGSIPVRILNVAEKCIYAMQRSTQAFTNIQGRLIVTNIWGTAHA